MVSLSISASKDTFVSELSPGTNYGSESSAAIAVGSVSGKIRRTLLEFDLSSLLDVPTHFINTVLLSLDCVTPTNARLMDFRRIDSQFTESTVTWNDQPSSTDFNIEATWTSSDRNTISVKSMLLNAIYDGHSYLGILIRYIDESVDGDLHINSVYTIEASTGSQDPWILIEYDTYSQARLKGSLCQNLLDKSGWGEITMTDHNCPTGDAAEFTFKTQWDSSYTDVLLDVDETVEYTSGTKHHSFKLYSMSCDSAPCDNLAAATIEERFWDTGNAYVKTGGDNDRNGRSWAEAWKTITHAANEVFDGQDVRIGFGTYGSETDVTPDNAGSTGIKYTPETADSGGGTGSVTINM